MIEEYKQQRIAKVKPGTVNREIALLKHMLNLAITWGMAANNPMKGVKLFREDNFKFHYFTDDEMQRLLAVCTDYFKPIVLTAFFTGMRKGEILGLQWDQVDFEKRLITVLYSKNGRTRKIDINNTLLAVLKDLKEKAFSEFVFTCKRTKLPPGKIQTAWLTAIKNSGIIRCRFHDLRHTFASNLAARNIDVVTVMELMGHSDIKMTMRYFHSAPESKIKAVASLEDCIREDHSHFLVTGPVMQQSMRA